MAVELETNVMVRGEIKYADHFPTKKPGEMPDRLKLKSMAWEKKDPESGDWLKIGEDYVFLPLGAVDVLVDLGALVAPAGQTDNKGNPKYIPQAGKPLEFTRKERDGGKGKKVKIHVCRLAGQKEWVEVPLDRREGAAAAPAASQAGQSTSQPTARSGDLRPSPAALSAASVHDQRQRWMVFRDTYQQCLAIAEDVWKERMEVAFTAQNSLAEMDPEANEANIRVPMATPLDRLRFLKEATVSLFIEASRTGLTGVPKKKKAAARPAPAPAPPPKPAPAPAPPPAKTFDGKPPVEDDEEPYDEDGEERPVAADGREIDDDLPF